MTRISVGADNYFDFGYDTAIFDTGIFEVRERRVVSRIEASLSQQSVSAEAGAIAGALFDTATFDSGPFSTRTRRPFVEPVSAQVQPIEIIAEVSHDG